MHLLLLLILLFRSTENAFHKNNETSLYKLNQHKKQKNNISFYDSM